MPVSNSVDAVLDHGLHSNEEHPLPQHVFGFPRLFTWDISFRYKIRPKEVGQSMALILSVLILASAIVLTLLAGVQKPRHPKSLPASRVRSSTNLSTLTMPSRFHRLLPGLQHRRAQTLILP